MLRFRDHLPAAILFYLCCLYYEFYCPGKDDIIIVKMCILTVHMLILIWMLYIIMYFFVHLVDFLVVPSNCAYWLGVLFVIACYVCNFCCLVLHNRFSSISSLVVKLAPTENMCVLDLLMVLGCVLLCLTCLVFVNWTELNVCTVCFWMNECSSKMFLFSNK